MEIEIQEDMQQEQQHEQDPQQKPQKKEYLLPDGFGLSLEEVRALILKLCDIKVDKDDPILLTVPILNACLNEQKKLQDEYKEHLKAVYQEVLEVFLENLDKRLQSGNYKVEVEAKKANPRDTLALYGIIIFQTLALLAVYFW